jgi:hypothetical protein
MCGSRGRRQEPSEQARGEYMTCTSRALQALVLLLACSVCHHKHSDRTDGRSRLRINKSGMQGTRRQSGLDMRRLLLQKKSKSLSAETRLNRVPSSYYL